MLFFVRTENEQQCGSKLARQRTRKTSLGNGIQFLLVTVSRILAAKSRRRFHIQMAEMLEL